MTSVAQGIANAATTVTTAQTDAEKYANILAHPPTGNPTPAQLAELEQAIAFFSAMKSGGTFTTPTGQVINFAQFGSAGIFGSKTAGFLAALDKVLSDYNGPVTIQVSNTGCGTTPAIIYDATTGKPATLLDLINNPNHTFTFKYSNYGFSGAVNWQSGSLSGSGTVTKDAEGNTIPGGGMNYSEDSGCGYDNINVSASGAALMNYINISPGVSGATVSADGNALGNYIGQYL